MVNITNQDKEIIRQLYFRDLYDLDYITKYFGGKYEYASIRSCVFKMIEEWGN